MSVDEKGEQSSKVKRRMSVRSPIYVGGLPANITAGEGVVRVKSFSYKTLWLGIKRSFEIEKEGKKYDSNFFYLLFFRQK